MAKRKDVEKIMAEKVAEKSESKHQLDFEEGINEFREIMDKKKSEKPEPKPEPKSELKPEPKSEPKPEPKPELELEKPEMKPEPELDPKPEKPAPQMNKSVEPVRVPEESKAAEPEVVSTPVLSSLGAVVSDNATALARFGLGGGKRHLDGPGKAYQYFSREYGEWKLTPNYWWACQFGSGDINVVLVCYKDGKIDHLLTEREAEQYI